ncbi:MAG: hypothetical protein AAF492_13965, partial [Verrucomicrobiota bacterium]
MLLYALSSSLYPYPDATSRLVMQHTGVDPVRPMSNPLWSLLMQAAAALPFGLLSARANGLSVVCGSLAVFLFVRLQLRADRHEDSEKISPWIAPVTAAAGGLYLALALPSWLMHTRGHYAAFHLLLLMTATTMTMDYARHPTLGRAAGLGFLFALAGVESPDVLVAAPFLLASLIPGLFSRARHVVLKDFGGLIVGGLIGLLFFLLPAALYLQTPAAGLISEDGLSL